MNEMSPPGAPAGLSGSTVTTSPLARFPRADGSRVPYPVFSSAEIAALEQERIFEGPTWSFLGLEA